MKKTLVAVAALAAIGAAQAQSSVAVYGNLEASVVSGGKAATSTAPTPATVFDGAGVFSTTLFGFKGTEDLGGGMKSGFQLEGGLSVGNGASGQNGGGNTGLFNRVASVNVGGSFGTVTLGNQLSPFVLAEIQGFAAPNLSNFVNYMAIAGAGSIGQSNGNAAFFVPNLVTYTTPTMGGFSATLDSQVAPTGQSARTEVIGNYAAGPLAARVGFTSAGNSLTNAYGTGTGFQTSLINGTYAIDALTLGAGYTMSKATGLKAGQAKEVDTYQVSAAYQVSPALKLSVANFGNNKTTKQTVTNFAADYSLSKATGVYLMVGSGSNTAPLHTSQTSASGTAFAVGIHKGF